MNKSITSTLNSWKQMLLVNMDNITPDFIAKSATEYLNQIDINPSIIVKLVDELHGDFFAIAGAFNPCEIHTHFELELFFGDDFIDVEIDKDWVEMFALELISVAIHEYRHYYQNTERGATLVVTAYKDAINKNQKYLGDTDEIDAYSISITYQLLQNVGKYVASNLLKYPAAITSGHSMDLYEYMTAFDADITHPVIKKLFTKIGAQLI